MLLTRASSLLKTSKRRFILNFGTNASSLRKRLVRWGILGTSAKTIGTFICKIISLKAGSIQITDTTNQSHSLGPHWATRSVAGAVTEIITGCVLELSSKI